jgi:transcriptional regulator with XRE-family HTH domain
LKKDGVKKMNVGFKIKELRRQKGWLQREFGDKLGVNQQTVSGWENGVIEPTISKLKKIADVFGVKVDYFKEDPEDGKDHVIELIDKLIAQGKIKSPDDIPDDLAKLIMYAVKMDIQSKLLEQD